LSPNQDPSQDVNPTFDSNTSTNNNVQKPKKNKTDANLSPDDPNQVGLYHPEDQIISQVEFIVPLISLERKALDKKT
jgi:hypothetical protein